MQKILIEKEAEDLLEKEGFPVAKRVVVKTKNELDSAIKKIGFPIALKIISKKILHKTDVGGVKLNLKTKNEVEQAYRELKKIKGFEGVLVQYYVEGKYVLIGLKKDPTFGHVIAVGTGGIYTEVLKDVSFRVCPITKKDAMGMLKELKGYPILRGVREKPVNVTKIIEVIIKTSNLAKKYPKIKELDINPLVVDKNKAVIVDARIIFG